MEADPEYELAEDALHSPALRGEPAVQCCSGSTTAGGQSGCKLQSQHSAAVFSTGQLEDHYEVFRKQTSSQSTGSCGVQVGPLIGRGGFGRVYAGQSKKDGRPVAIKQIGLTRVTNWGQVGAYSPQSFGEISKQIICNGFLSPKHSIHLLALRFPKGSQWFNKSP